jgi:quercetin dioxygenase-like cupin family protein
MAQNSITAYEDLQFGSLGERSPLEAALLWGDPEAGPAAVLARFSEGNTEPWHSHSSAHHAVLVEGEFQARSQDGGDDSMEVFGPGAYAVQPGGTVHREINAGAGEMVALASFAGPVDFVPAG